MRSLIIIILFAFTLLSCGEQTNTAHTTLTEKEYKIIIIEGCEYIMCATIGGYQGFGYMAHKGNCKSPVHMAKIYDDVTIRRGKMRIDTTYNIDTVYVD